MSWWFELEESGFGALFDDAVVRCLVADLRFLKTQTKTTKIHTLLKGLSHIQWSQHGSTRTIAPGSSVLSPAGVSPCHTPGRHPAWSLVHRHIRIKNKPAQFSFPGGISWSVLSVFFTDKFALSQSDARISVAYNSCQWKTLTKRLMKCPPGVHGRKMIRYHMTPGRHRVLSV